jgi:syntaxin-binding protein 5
VRAYEYVVPPGAPGGAGYHGHQDLLSHRRPDVTALAVHPCGHFFATGYTDGSIAFWAVEDEDKPLMVLTLDGEQDVNVADTSRLDAAMSKHGYKSPREPIFRLAWSSFANSDDPRGGDTVLTVLGGIKAEDVPAVTTLLLPAFNPPEPPALAVPNSTMLHPNIRAAMRQSVTPKNLHIYSTVGTPQDFLLLPKESPHFAGSYDPYAILLLSDGEKDARAIEAYQFPPPIYDIHERAKPPVAPSKDASEQLEDVLSEEIASTLESMQLNDEPKSLETPPAFWSGPLGVTHGDLIAFERDAYETLVMERVHEDDGLRLRGGSAWVDDDEHQMKLLRVRFIYFT